MEEHAALALNNATNTVWVMKVPRFVMQHMANANNSQHPLGTVCVIEDGAMSSLRPTDRSYMVKLDSVADSLPREYEMRFSASPPASYVISRSKDANQAVPKHEGRVEAKGEIRPRELGKEYRGLLKERGDAVSALKERRSMGTITDDRDIRRPGLDHRRVEQEERADRYKRQQRREQSSKKRVRLALSGGELKDKVMDLFGRQNYWSRPDLIHEVGNGQALGKCLDDLCMKVTKKGPHYGDFQLKPEYRL